MDLIQDILLKVDTGYVIAIIIITEIFKILILRNKSKYILGIKKRKLRDILCYVIPLLLGILLIGDIKEGLRLGAVSGFVFSIIKPIKKTIISKFSS